MGTILVVRGGIRGDNNNDLVWVGNATNQAVKLSSITDDGYHIFVSDAVYKKMMKSSTHATDGRSMWEGRSWKNQRVYRSNWTWTPS